MKHFCIACETTKTVSITVKLIFLNKNTQINVLKDKPNPNVIIIT